MPGTALSVFSVISAHTGGLPVVLVPQHLDVGRGEQPCLQGGRQAGQDVAGEGGVGQAGRGRRQSGLVQGLELGFDVFAFVVEFGEPGADAGAHRGGCGVGRVGGELL
jgi:hypothetical protein